MRIAHFSDCYLPRINGVSTSVQLLKVALERAGHQVDLYVPQYPGATESEELRRLPSSYIALQPEDRMIIPWSAAARQMLRGPSYDIVHVHTPFAAGWLGLLKAKLQRTPLVFTHHTLWEEYAHYLKGIPLWLGRWVGREVCDQFFRRAAAVVLPSQEVAQSLVGQRIRGPYRVIPTGICCRDFREGQPEPVWQELGLPPDSPLLLYIGRLGKEKSLEFLLRAFQQYRQQGGLSTLVLIGGGPERESLEQLSSQLGLQTWVTFLGYRPRDQLRHYLAAAQAFVFASQTETQGLVLLEAAAAGVPVVAICASGVNEAVLPQITGILSPPEQLETFVAGMLTVQHDQEMRQKMSNNARAWAETLSDQEMARKMLELYRFVLA